MSESAVRPDHARTLAEPERRREPVQRRHPVFIRNHWNNTLSLFRHSVGYLSSQPCGILSSPSPFFLSDLLTNASLPSFNTYRRVKTSCGQQWAPPAKCF